MADVLITGAAGRIGRVLTEAVHAAGHAVRALDVQRPEALPPGVRFLEADITDPAAMDAACDGVEAVIHLAGHPSSRDWDVVERLNVRGARVVFDAAGRAGARRILYASSIHVVGLHPAGAALTSDLPPAPDGPYGLSKLIGEELLRLACLEYGLAGLAIRICSFRPEPTNARELRTWISPDDMARLALAGLTADLDGFTFVWGASDNSRLEVHRDVWRRLGYAPQSDAERYAADLARAGVDITVPSEHPLMGAHFVSPSILARISPAGRSSPD